MKKKSIFHNIIYMKCRKQLRYYRLPISNLWEVHLDEDLWKRVCNVANYRRCTFSWITRYCVFRLAIKRVLKMRPAMEIHSNWVKQQHQESLRIHRHLICLYVEDEKLLKLAAMKLGISVSHMIRLALYWFLPKLENNKVWWAQIYYHGTKICRFLDITRQNKLKLPFWENTFYAKWPLEMWWKRPWHTIRIPYTPDNFEHVIYSLWIPEDTSI